MNEKSVNKLIQLKNIIIICNQSALCGLHNIDMQPMRKTHIYTKHTTTVSLSVIRMILIKCTMDMGNKRLPYSLMIS